MPGALVDAFQPETTTKDPLVGRLKAWRLAEARRRRLPAFRILTNQALEGLAAARPTNEGALLAVRGIGPAIARRYADVLLEICSGRTRDLQGA